MQTIARLNTFSVVAAFDVGTTYSGYAYSFTEDPFKVIMNRNWLNSGSSHVIALKTATSVLLDAKGELFACSRKTTPRLEIVQAF
ncbi:hypothetical protein DPMN_118759 [Dreissena polymorpha]|uniref:Uncharacterized protein n=1 Tax=Dreissena polymorpha TaxID=45954 RepID=A0A9D4GI05_DREPO|nr:hypothetical protein DPMN_118759 [Dreissena polymorpha]